MIQNLKDLEKFFKLCRKQGVIEANLVSHTYKFGDLPQDVADNVSISADESTDPYANFPQGTLTPEQLTYYSAGGSPDEDPYRGEQ